MRLLIEVPTWLGDCVMASGSINKLITHLNPSEVIIFGSPTSTALFTEHPKVTEIIIDNTKYGFRIANIIRLSKRLKADIGVTYRNHIYSKLLLFLSTKSYYWQKKSYGGHLAQNYNQYINSIIKQDLQISYPKIYFDSIQYKKKTIGINPGAAYGSAKRWYPEEFAKVANQLAAQYDIIIFGGPGEEEIAYDIEKSLTISNYKNLCGKLKIPKLCQMIGGLELMITNDSGPMHIAASYQVSTIAIIGPSKYKETYPFHTKYKLLRANLECSPCAKRVCPLKGDKHHLCMKLITAEDVLKSIGEI
jgi:heptosyltransferase-2